MQPAPVANLLHERIGFVGASTPTLASITSTGNITVRPAGTDVDALAAEIQPEALVFVRDAFGHLKAIGATKAAQPLLDKAGVAPDDGVTDLGAGFVQAAAQRFYDREPKVRVLA